MPLGRWYDAPTVAPYPKSPLLMIYVPSRLFDDLWCSFSRKNYCTTVGFHFVLYLPLLPYRKQGAERYLIGPAQWQHQPPTNNVYSCSLLLGFK